MGVPTQVSRSLKLLLNMHLFMVFQRYLYPYAYLWVSSYAQYAFLYMSISGFIHIPLSISLYLGIKRFPFVYDNIKVSLSLLHFTGLSLGFQICTSLHTFAWAAIDTPLCVPIRVCQNNSLYKDILCFEIFSSKYAYICNSKHASVYVCISFLELLLYIYT